MRIRLTSIGGLAFGVFLLCRGAEAYDLRTHGSVTEQSYATSQGLARYLDAMDIRPGDVFDSRAITPFAQLAEFNNNGTARGWMIEGAIREDDFQEHLVLAQLGCPQPKNPHSDIDRPKHHFFDIQRGGAGIPLVGGISAPDWALGREGRGPASNQNQFSLADARVYQIRSLTESRRVERDRNTARLFRTLGQVTHVLQDMAQPEHTRNDPHLGCTNALARFLGGEKSWYEAYIETRALNQPYRTRSAASRPLVLDGDDPVGFPTYRDYWANASGMGLAEFSSRNFFSAGTNLGTFSLAGPCGGLPQPVCDPQAYRTEDLDATIPTLAGDVLTGRVRFFLRDIADPLTGHVTPNVRVSSRSFWDRHLETSQQRPKFSLNTYNYDAMADVLLPRAVGYSAGFLDYFFRGRLDVDLVSDSTNPSVARLTGTNTSAEALVAGTLILYAEDTTTGARSAVTALDPTAITGVVPGGAVTSARFRVPDGAERFVGVYQGALGNEVESVIGRVLGGVRVEEVFSEGTRWKLRTPKGVFGLITESGPLSVAQYEVVKWGDSDSALVARTPLDVPQPTVAVFDVPRQPGSSELVLDIPSGGTDIVLRQTKGVPFPSAAPLVMVDFTQTVVYRQHLARAQASSTSVWVPFPPPNPDPDNLGSYNSGDSSFSPFTFELAYEQTILFRQSFPVMLDLPHNRDTGTVFDPYAWQLQDVSVDASGRPLGLVSVFLGEPQVAPVTVPVFRVGSSGDTEPYTTRTIGPYFPEQIATLLWALVDLEQGTVVAATAGPVVTINAQRLDDATDQGCCVGNRTFFVHATQRYSGGPENGTIVDGGWGPAGRILPGDRDTIGTVTDVTLPANGEQSLSLDGWLRDELRQAMIARGRYTIQPLNTPTDFLFVYTCDGSHVCSAMRVHQPQEGWVLRDPGQLRQARRTRPVGGHERLVFLSQSFVDNADEFGYIGDLLVWDPGLARAQFVGAPIRPGAHSLGSATSAAALVSFDVFATGEYGTTLFRLDPAQASTSFPNVDLTEAYTLLEPSYLYNADDLRFHRAQPSLDATALPATLADVVGSPTGDYHSIRLVAP